MKLVVATRNEAKAQEMIQILRQILDDNWEVVSFVGFPDFPEPEEIANTYRENATIKAEAAAAYTNELCIADDAGLEVDVLNGEPGVHSKRFGGEDLPFSQKIALLLKRLEGNANRTARFKCAVAISKTGQKTELFESSCEGKILESPRGSGGFGYDSIFSIPAINKTFAEMTQEEKNTISHRGKVLSQFAEWTHSMKMPAS